MEGTQQSKSVIAQDVEIVGSVKCSTNIQLDGRLTGDLTCTGNATIGPSANIKGNISCDSVSVLGTLNGNIAAKDRIELKSSAHVNGDIRAKRLTVEDGVTFVGKSEVNPSGAPTPRVSADARAAESGDGASEDDGKGKSTIFAKK